MALSFGRPRLIIPTLRGSSTSTTAAPVGSALASRVGCGAFGELDGGDHTGLLLLIRGARVALADHH